VSPDKRDIFLKNEAEVVDGLRIKLSEFFEDIQRIKAYDNSSMSKSSHIAIPGAA